MKIDITRTFKKPDGTLYHEPLLDEEGNQIITDGKKQWFGPTTLKDVIKTALLSTNNPMNPSAPKLEPAEKYERWKIVKKIDELDDKTLDKNMLSVTVEEVKIIKDTVGEIFQTIIMGQAWDYLEGN